MATLSTNDRIGVWAEYVQQLSAEIDMAASTRLDEVRAAVDAVDAWLDDSQAGYNSALPAEFTAWATSRQREHLLMLVMLKRFNAGA